MKNFSKFEFMSMILGFNCVTCLALFFIFFEINLICLYEIDLLMKNSVSFNFIIYMDWMTFLFMFIVFFISFLILMYSKIYMGKECYRFMWLTFLFIFFMIVMILTPSCLGVLVGWDGLGIISYCLVIYYKSSDAFNSGFITAATNRLGDSMLLLSIVWLSMEGGFLVFEISMGTLFLILSCMTKSAQFPFSAWLPAAMAAPTPISSLVHSSTLVTAGVYLMIRFYYCYVGTFMLFLLFMSSLLTVLIAGMSTLSEFDFKRLVAMSTLGQLGFMMVILSIGYPYVAFFHLLIHALFKAMLFMCAGSIIHSGLGVQDLRMMGNLNFDIITKSCLCISVFNLMGVPFTSGFYSKDSLLEIFYSSYSGLGLGAIFMCMAMITVAYSLRMLIFLSSYWSWVLFVETSYKLTLSILMLSLMVFFSGSVLNWVTHQLDLIMLNFSIKITPLLMIMLGVCWHGMTQKNQMIFFMLSSMFFLNTVTKNLSGMIQVFMKMLKLLDQGFLESGIFNLKKKSTQISLTLTKMSQKSFLSSMGSFMLIILMV
uniref:NADH dehydrogenase subunit 5 n=1 Tax=Egeirotrioza xingi TaxID=3132083 RepID=UPI0030FF3BB9